MLEIILALITGWLAFQSEQPTSFGEFLLFILIWIVYFAIGIAIIRFLKKDLKPVISPKSIKHPADESYERSIQATAQVVIDYHRKKENDYKAMFLMISKRLEPLLLRYNNPDIPKMWKLNYSSNSVGFDFEITPFCKDEDLREHISEVISETILIYFDYL